jgi:TIR domain
VSKLRQARRNAAPATPPRVYVFISYASKDKDLVNKIVNLLNETFPFAPLSIFLDVSVIEAGGNYAEAIAQALDEADILLLIFTGRKKASHSWTGFEVGFFDRSVRQRPKGRTGSNRIFIPFCIGADSPDMLHFT